MFPLNQYFLKKKNKKYHKWRDGEINFAGSKVNYSLRKRSLSKTVSIAPTAEGNKLQE